MKRKRNEFIEAHGKGDVMPSSFMEAGMLSSFPHDKIKLLDVGSCYNPLIDLQDSDVFDITALDICPAAPSVFQSNFLELQLGPMKFDPVKSQDSDQHKGFLTHLPSKSFHVVAMSLVLCYLPSPEMRRDMVLKARELLDVDKSHEHR